MSQIFKVMAAAAKLALKVVKQINGHSTRVGAAQDMDAADTNVVGIMQAGGWTTPKMVGRYTSQ